MGATKFVLFIVEGETDELALGRALTSLFASGEHPGPRFGIVRGDIGTCSRCRKSRFDD